MYQIVEYALWVAFAFIIMVIAVLLYRKSSGDGGDEAADGTETGSDGSLSGPGEQPDMPDRISDGSGAGSGGLTGRRHDGSGSGGITGDGRDGSGGLTDDGRIGSDDPGFAGAVVREEAGQHTGSRRRAAEAGEGSQRDRSSGERQPDSDDSVYGKDAEPSAAYSGMASSADGLREYQADSPGEAGMAEEDIPPENYRLFDSPVSGRVIPLAQVPEWAFASGAAGIGVGIVPDNGKIYAPFDGTVRSVYPGGHALSLTSVDGVDAVIHMGIDTVRLEGRGFQANVRQGMAVQRGDLIAVFDPAYLRAHEYDTTVLYLLTNQPEQIQMKAATGDCVEALQPVMGVARLRQG